jgi:hypothetical protein
MNELGPTYSTHKGRFAAGGFLWYVGGIIVVGGVVALVRGLLTFDAMSALGGAGTFALAMLAGGGCVLYAYSLLAQELVAHQYGFVWKRFLRAPLVVRWDQVRGVQTRTEYGGRGTFHTKGQNVELELRLADGTTLVLTNDLDRVEELRGYMTTPQPAAATAPSPWG